MKFSTLVLFSLIFAAPVTAAPGFYEEAELASGNTVIVSASLLAKVRLVFDRELNPGPTTWPGGCSLRLTLAEAEYIGDVYEWAGSDESPQQFEEEIELTYGGTWGASLVISRGAVNVNIETLVDDGASPTSACTVVEMTDEEALWVGDWLIEAATPGK